MSELITALALVLVIEGILPFLSPHGYKRAVGQVLQMPAQHVRWYGLGLMTAGAVLLYFMRHIGGQLLV